ncbi:MAG: leucine-rich repeat domain-containing protein [Clostridia bacterium]|nr:leucine-rich repeat domain-containing protein [Clostridia bacterium]
MNMKSILKIAICLIAAAGVAACQTKEETVTGFSLDTDEIAVDCEGGTETVNVSSDVEWSVSTTQPWITVSPANGVGSMTCTVSIDTTLIVGVREGQISFVPKGLSTRTIDVYQTGYGNVIYVSEPKVTIPASANYSDRYFESTVVTNVEFDIDVEYLQNTEPDEDGVYETPTGWLTVPSVNITFDRGARPRTAILKFEWKTNTDWIERAAKISFIPSGKDEGAELAAEAGIELSQEAAEEITDDARGDSLAILSIRDQLNMLFTMDASEKLQNWDGVVLWEKTDKDLPTDDDGNVITDAIGRVRECSFYYFHSYETIPATVKYLKYCEKIIFYSNVNSFLKSIALESDICELKYLKYLEIGAYGLVSLPDDLGRLTRLETLSLSSNNFTTIPDVLTPENFPNLTVLNLLGNRRYVTSDLREADTYDPDIGMHIHMQNDAAAEGVRRLFLWENLEELDLNYNYIEGHVPDFAVGTVVDGKLMEPFREGEDFVALRDTVAWLWTEEGQKIPRILPKCKSLKINLNYFTGDAPDWIMYHPYLIDWVPDTFIFNQNEFGKDSNGNLVQFDNAPSSYSYYYEKYPLYEDKYTYDDGTYGGN